jgi:hypothetical protein
VFGAEDSVSGTRAVGTAALAIEAAADGDAGSATDVVGSTLSAGRSAPDDAATLSTTVGVGVGTSVLSISTGVWATCAEKGATVTWSGTGESVF